MRHCFSRRAKLLKATATNYKHACTTTQYTLVTVKTLSSKAQSKLGSLLSSPSCRKLLSQVSKTPALAENFCSKPKRPATNQILLRTAKTSQDCRKLRKQLGSRGYSHRTTSAAQMLTFSHEGALLVPSFQCVHMCACVSYASKPCLLCNVNHLS